ncbi:hypothetical protein [Maridesulfovibrio sp.]|uniref:hypothetical protein n=1 Tax=Maridesulfovibrio sp. TaxID=2795000 RepID=UPI0029C9B31A|nr:hypothetical protein [Maridesulfovibrio sp.]
MRRFAIITILFILCQLPSPAHARSMEEERAMCLTRNALARAQCKDPHEFSYMGTKRGNIHIFTGFYGAKNTDFFCKIEDGEITILSRKKKFRRTVKYYIDENECGIIEDYPASCSKRSVIKCCFPKSKKELEADKEAEFWQRSIPDLLREDQQKAIEELQNRTSKSSETKQEEQ